MRRIFFSLMIVLIAFRGMVGDAMAFEMVSGMGKSATIATPATVNAIQSVAHHADFTPANGTYPMKKLASVPCHEAADVSLDEASEHACTACMVCHSPILGRSAVVTQVTDFVPAPIPQSGDTWLSADLYLLQKPPVL